MGIVTLLYSAAQVRELDRIAIEEYGIPGLTLMKRAAEACVEALLVSWPDPGKVAIVCGSGNNAADGFIVAGLLAARNIATVVGLVGAADKFVGQDTDAGAAYAFCLDAGVAVQNVSEALENADVIVDALLGTGISGAVRAEYELAISAINAAEGAILSVDLPSGLCSDTGVQLGAAVKADVTVTFIGYKFGLMTNDGPEHVGKLVFSDLQVPESVYSSVPGLAETLEYEALISVLPKRKKNAHKVSHGHLLIVGGGKGMAGAAALAAEAAMYAGSGMVSVATDPGNVTAIIARRPEVMARGVRSADELGPMLERCTGIVVGPGLGIDPWGKALLEAVLNSNLPMVVDADGLNLIAGTGLTRSNWILTPHPGEAKRLLGSTVQDDRLEATRALQKKYGGIALLKGAGTVIASGDHIVVNPYGNPGMAVAGMGDLLAGVIGSLLVQGLSPTEATQLGAVVHSLAADQLVEVQGERGMLASDLPPIIRTLLNPQ